MSNKASTMPINTSSKESENPQKQEKKMKATHTIPCTVKDYIYLLKLILINVAY